MEELDNKKLLEKYPFLILKNSMTGEVIAQNDSEHFHIEFKDDIPQGWWKAFGLAYLDDFKEMLDKHSVDYDKVIFFQVKEKYGSLRVYHNGMPEEWDAHEHAWEYISEHTCVKCGKFPVRMRDDGWVCPWCDDCFKENHDNLSEEDFAKYREKWTIDKDDRLQEYLVINHFSKDGDYQEWIDMKPYYNKLCWKYTDKDLILKDELEKLMEEKANAK